MSQSIKLTPENILHAYTMGAFPMAESRDAPVQWFTADPRAIMPLDTFHVRKSLRRVVEKKIYHITTDTAFERVIRGCAAPRKASEETWINEEITTAFVRLHEMGFAHSVEAWRASDSTQHSPASAVQPGEAELCGGLYGVAIGGVFFGESMFSRATDASKVCLVHLVERLRARGFQLLDVQFRNDHLTQFGIEELRQKEYMKRLHAALAVSVQWE